jgi:hypothetical protein
MVDGEYRRLVELPEGIEANTSYSMRFRATTRGEATDLRLKVWKEGEDEPSESTLELLGDTERKLRGQSGGFGIVTTQGGNEGRAVWYDDYRAEFVEYPMAEPNRRGR